MRAGIVEAVERLAQVAAERRRARRAGASPGAGSSCSLSARRAPSAAETPASRWREHAPHAPLVVVAVEPEARLRCASGESRP